MEAVSIFWFRRDLRLNDNHGLFKALASGHPVLPLFIFDTDILSEITDPSDRRVQFIHQEINHLKKQLEALGSSLLVYRGKPGDLFSHLLETYPVAAVYTNHDYEPYARKRDDAIREQLGQSGVPLHCFKDQVVFEKDEVVKNDGTPYTVYTPYSRKWLASARFPLTVYPSENHLHTLLKTQPAPMPTLQDLGFAETAFEYPSRTIPESLIRTYDKTRDFPGVDGTSGLGIHLRFGTISIRQLANQAASLNPVFLGELIWREFFMMILWHFPKTTTQAFKPSYDRIAWRNQEQEFERWKNGQTGYPLVDAGMRQLLQTGQMHNRVRMVTASFLVKHLLIDWRWGEAWFATRLLDFELASNVGNWQWAAGSGCDAAPYFRVFNPILQTQRFDKDLRYIAKWVPEFRDPRYPQPMVDHSLARDRVLAEFKKALA